MSTPNTNITLIKVLAERLAMERSNSRMYVSSPREVVQVSSTWIYILNRLMANTSDSPQQSLLDRTCEPKPKRRKTSFKIWEDPVSDNELERNEHTMHDQDAHRKLPSLTSFSSTTLLSDNAVPHGSGPWTPINRTFPTQTTIPIVDNTPSSKTTLTFSYSDIDPTAGKSFKSTFSMSEAEKYPNARAGVPTGVKQKYVYKPGILFPAPPMEDLGLISTGPYTKKETYHHLDKDPNAVDKGRRPAPLKLLTFPSGAPCDISLEHPTPDFTTWLRAHSASPILRSSPVRTTTLNADIPQALRGSATTSRINQRALLSPIIAATARRAVSVSESQPNSLLFNTSKTIGAKGVFIEPICAKPSQNLNRTPPPEPPLLPPQQRFPGAAQIICSCHRPAETFKVKIVECYNPGCVVGWYHYACLGKNHKLSALHGRWTCDLCKAEKHWGVATTHTNMESAFPASEMAEGLGGPGGIDYFANAYGLGITMELYGGLRPRAARSLGWAIFDVEAVERAIGKAEHDALTRLQEHGIDLAESFGLQEYGTGLMSGSELQEDLGVLAEGSEGIAEGSEDLGSSSELSSSSE